MDDGASDTMLPRQTWWYRPSFAWYWSSTAVSGTGNAVSTLVVPIVAAVDLHASPGGMSALVIVGMLPSLVLQVVVAKAVSGVVQSAFAAPLVVDLLEPEDVVGATGKINGTMSATDIVGDQPLSDVFADAVAALDSPDPVCMSAAMGEHVPISGRAGRVSDVSEDVFGRSRISMVADRLCGFIPMMTVPNCSLLTRRGMGQRGGHRYCEPAGPS
jgi:hypothetical protein